MRYLNIAGKEYRVEANFNAIMDFMEQIGERDLDFLTKGLSLKQWVSMMICCINEGERLDNKPHSLTRESLGELSFVEVSAAVQSFIKIFSLQNGADEGELESKKK